MHSISFYTFIVSCFFILSCNTSKNAVSTATNEATNEMKSNAERLSEAGFEEMTVIDMKQEDGCGFILKSTTNKQIYNPIEWIEEEIKVNGNVVWVKYRTSKITQTTCLKSTPIIIDEIKLPK
jgi:hypothetical protein